MKWAPRGYGGERRPPEHVKREGWQAQRVLVIEADDVRLTWPERELVRQLGGAVTVDPQNGFPVPVADANGRTSVPTVWVPCGRPPQARPNSRWRTARTLPRSGRFTRCGRRRRGWGWLAA